MTPHTLQHHHARISLTPGGPAHGPVDGGWWPHTRNLGSEVPTALTAAEPRLGRVARLLYRMGDWEPAPGRITVGGRTVRLDGYHYQQRDTVTLVGLDGARMVLLVVPPDADPFDARTAMDRAADPGNTTPAERILEDNPTDDHPDADDPAQEQWDDEGGASTVGPPRDLHPALARRTSKVVPL